jgi:DNA-binding transcriptional ArsR family regulator
MTATATKSTIAPAMSEPAENACCLPIVEGPTISEAEAEVYASWMKAIADPTRIRILNLLAQSSEPVCVCEIEPHFPVGQSTISHHLKILKDVRFIVAERRGTFMYYHLNESCLQAFPLAAQRILNV